MVNIAFTGKMHSGKSTGTKYLVENYGYTVHNFKDSLIREMKENFSPVIHELKNWYGFKTDDEIFAEKPGIFRKLMQCYGTDLRRKDDENYWVNLWKNSDSLNAEKITVDDVRFKNEMDVVRDMGFVVIRTICPDIIATSNHASETEQESFDVDYTITAAFGDLVSFHEQLEAIMKDIDEKSKEEN